MERKIAVSFLLAITLIPSLALAIYDWQDLRVNNIYSTVTNYGVLGQVQGGSDAGTYWPRPAMDTLNNLLPPLMNYVYGWGLWVGAQVKTTRSIGGITLDTLVTIGYNPNNYSYEFTPGAVVVGVPQDPADSSAKVYVSTDADWPLKKTSGQDSIISMCDTRCTYNDYLTTAHATGGRPLKIEVTQTTYQWNLPVLEDLIYFLWEVKNTGTDTLYNVYLAPTADCDIGNEADAAANDVCYYDTTTNMAYQYQVDSAEAGWTRKPGCVGISILQGPVATKDYTYPDGRQIFTGDTLGLTHYKVFLIAGWPEDLEQYMFLAGYSYLTGDYRAFDPKPSPGDCRFIASTGPVDLAPGASIRLVACLICAGYNYAYLNSDDTLSIDSLRLKARYAKTFFDQLGVTGAPNENTITSFGLLQNAPNPFRQQTTISYQTSKSEMVNLKVYNIAGQTVKTLVNEDKKAGSYEIRWDGKDECGNLVASGVYFCQLKAGEKIVTKRMMLLR
ncbi:MAG: FlgD immunoglobulin-like domain containing protein [bacterium]|nr:FlgD immunoglobulin-like domain containing protein [bacterium]